MRARNIKPDFFRDAELAEVTIEARYLFIGLWCLADREGKLKDKPKQIRFEVFPETKTKDDIETLLNSLVEHNLVIRYAIENIKYIKVVNFLKHQSPHHTEMQSKIPDPPCVTVSYREPPEISSDIPLIPDSLIPDNLNPESRIKDLSTEPTQSSPKNGFDVQSLAKLWNEKAPPELSRVNLPFKRSPKPMAQIRDAIKRNPDPDWWASVMERIYQSSFLRGEKGWKANIDFVVKKAEEIVDGKYDSSGKCLQPGIATWLARQDAKGALNES